LNEARAFWRVRVATYRNVANYLLAAKSAERLAQLDMSSPVPGLPRSDARSIDSLLRTVLRSVSWDVTTGLLRNPDPLDFVGHSIQVESKSGKPSDEFPYGMVDPDEDEATLAAWLFEGAEKLMRQRLAAGNLELPVKAFIADVLMALRRASNSQSETGRLHGITLAELEQAIQNPNVLTEPATLEAYAIASQTLAWLRTIPWDRRGVEDASAEAPTATGQ
jgi:hypothetical protein